MGIWWWLLWHLPLPSVALWRVGRHCRGRSAAHLQRKTYLHPLHRCQRVLERTPGEGIRKVSHILTLTLSHPHPHTITHTLLPHSHILTLYPHTITSYTSTLILTLSLLTLAPSYSHYHFIYYAPSHPHTHILTLTPSHSHTHPHILCMWGSVVGIATQLHN